MSFARSRDGTRIFYHLTGAEHPRENGLLLCHPSFSSHRLWQLQERAFSAGRRFVSWDYRGHGRSEAPLDPERYRLQALLEDLSAVHEAALGDAPADVGGLSFGGTLAMEYALARPERVRRLLLFNTGPGFRKPEALAQWQEMLERSAQKLERVGLAEYLEGGRARAELLGLDPSTPASVALREALLSSDPTALALFARRVAGPVPNLVDRLAQIHQPALVLVGEKDEAFQAASRVLEAKLPNATRIEIPVAGHVLNVDQPSAFERAVNAFLDPS